MTATPARPSPRLFLIVLLWGGVVPRFQTIRVRALDRSGKPVDFEASGFHARVLQHEIDHLNGRLIIDRMTPASRLSVRGRLKELEREFKTPQHSLV